MVSFPERDTTYLKHSETRWIADEISRTLPYRKDCVDHEVDPTIPGLSV